jgi:hypothetical protein
LSTFFIESDAFCIIVHTSNRFVAQSAAFGICNGMEKF